MTFVPKYLYYGTDATSGIATKRCNFKIDVKVDFLEVQRKYQYLQNNLPH